MNIIPSTPLQPGPSGAQAPQRAPLRRGPLVLGALAGLAALVFGYAAASFFVGAVTLAAKCHTSQPGSDCATSDIGAVYLVLFGICMSVPAVLLGWLAVLRVKRARWLPR